MIKEKVSTPQPDPNTGLPYHWKITLEENQSLEWKGLYTGPIVLSEEQIAESCKRLLGISLSELTECAARELKPVPSLDSVGASVVIHSTTPDLKTFDGDLDKLIKGLIPSDYTSYKEARSVFLAGPGDLAVGRIQPWSTGVNLGKLEGVEIPGLDYYYISHALLALADQHSVEPVPEIDHIIAFLQQNDNATIRLYALEMEMQIFLIWLKRQAGLDYLLMDANSPEVARDWNRKSILFPSVPDALGIASEVNGLTPHEILEKEKEHSPLRKRLGCHFPVLPGYTVLRRGSSLEEFTEQLQAGASMLVERYGLTHGCFKAGESGDGARITPGVDLNDAQNLVALAKDAYRHGDNYIIEPLIQYNKVTRNGEELKVSPSAHVRWGEVAGGITLQFTEGTSWKGNIFIDEEISDSFGISQSHFLEIIHCMEEFLQGFREHDLGLAIAGLDFAIGQIGGGFGEETLIGVQDPNVSFTGAECLRVFMEKVNKNHPTPGNSSLYGATRIVKPGKNCTLPILRETAEKLSQNGIIADAIAAVPERWAMIAVAHEDPNSVMEALATFRSELEKLGLLLD